MRRHPLIFWSLALLATTTAALCFGAIFLSPPDIIRSLLSADDSLTKSLFLDIRLPRVLLGIIVGAALAVAGVIYQAIFCNDLADPYLLGVSSGAGLGAMIAFITTAALGASVVAWGLVPLCAFAGAVLAMVVVFRISRVAAGSRTTSLVLAGIAISYTLAALTSLVMVLAREQMSVIVYWNMGGLTRASWPYIAIISPIIITAVVYATTLAPRLDLMLLGSERAGQLGLDAKRFTTLALSVATILTAAAVSVTGLIGFVGLMVPHIVRSRYGSLHKTLVPVSALVGAILLVVSDMIARSAMAPIEFPVGIVTALIGGPFFVWLLISRGKQS